MVDSVVFVIKTKIVDSSASNLKFYGNKHILEALCTVRLSVQVKNDDKVLICQVKHIMYVGSFSFLRSVVVIPGTFHFFLYCSH